MSELQIAWLELGIIGGLGIIFAAAGITIRMILKKRNRLCTSQTSGVVVNYGLSTKNGMYPVVEYTVFGNVYRTRKKFQGVLTTRIFGLHVQPKAYEDEKGWLHIKTGSVANLRQLAEQLWSAGSRMTVFYNPDNPKQCYVQRPVSGGAVTAVFLLIGLFLILLSVLVFFLIQL